MSATEPVTKPCGVCGAPSTVTLGDIARREPAERLCRACLDVALQRAGELMRAFVRRRKARNVAT